MLSLRHPGINEVQYMTKQDERTAHSQLEKAWLDSRHNLGNVDRRVPPVHHAGRKAKNSVFALITVVLIFLLSIGAYWDHIRGFR